MEDQRKTGTSYVFCPSRDATGTRPNIPGLSRPFRDGWQLWILQKIVWTYTPRTFAIIMCYAVVGRQAEAASKASAYHHSIELFAWSRHTEEGCEVNIHIGLGRLMVYHLGNNCLLTRYVSTLQLLPLGEDRIRGPGETAVAAPTKVLQL